MTSKYLNFQALEKLTSLTFSKTESQILNTFERKSPEHPFLKAGLLQLPPLCYKSNITLSQF